MSGRTRGEKVKLPRASTVDLEPPPPGAWIHPVLPGGGELDWASGFLPPDEADTALAAILDAVPWKQEHVVLFGRRIAQPRLSCWMGDPGAVYTYSGATFEPTPWVEAAADIRRRVEAATRSSFNSVLLNLYRTGADSMGFHSDDEPELGNAPTIASVSLGATRRFVLRSRRRRGSTPSVRLPLEHGSLLVMRGETQRLWAHGIPREPSVAGARVNLTFRRIR
jgi:alkylated DNA repair dioxygenase AlkB